MRLDIPLFLATGGGGHTVPLALALPFGLLLLLIAAMPLTPERARHWWERRYPLVSVTLALLVAVYYVLSVPRGGATLGHTLHEYFSFIVLIGSLYIVSGGIHVHIEGEATPLRNVVFLALGSFVASIVGTTGASMVLIRPWIRMNKIRASAYHVAFFIFLVSNVGGLLTPIGDPPLFLGYLRGVPFFWLVVRVWPVWLFTVGVLLVVFYIYDRRCLARAPAQIQAETRFRGAVRLDGAANLVPLAAVVGAVFVTERYFAREIAMLAATLISYKFTPGQIHSQNRFSFGPIKEVAWLFLGIFTTMMPALNYLEQHGKDLGFTYPEQYYYATGGLSSVLDNAPTYMNFLQLAEATFAPATPAGAATEGTGAATGGLAALLESHPEIVIAISLGAVFFGAMTYIGNGPNFMVKSIAQDSGVHCPSFFGYLFKYGLPVLLPILALSAWVFL